MKEIINEINLMMIASHPNIIRFYGVTKLKGMIIVWSFVNMGIKTLKSISECFGFRYIRIETQPAT
ncbi:hypothetical protein C1646_685535 [Rhizophagus diaphanus]|nr:hypothetical protein C1646_685535 [Rhizophagus diaphanus] [Rhizophagus sp. MUCL 43196]